MGSDQRDILAGMEEAKIGIASGLHAVVEVLPPIRIETTA